MDVGLPDGQMGNSEVGHTNIGAGRIVYQELTRITKSAQDVYKRQHFDGVEYQVLWPRTETYPFEAQLSEALEGLNVLFSSPFQPACVQQFLRRKEEFLTLYVKCGQAFSVSGRALPERRRAYLEHLDEVLKDLEALREELNHTPEAHDAREILLNPLNRDGNPRSARHRLARHRIVDAQRRDGHDPARLLQPVSYTHLTGYTPCAEPMDTASASTPVCSTNKRACSGSV